MQYLLMLGFPFFYKVIINMHGFCSMERRQENHQLLVGSRQRRKEIQSVLGRCRMTLAKPVKENLLHMNKEKQHHSIQELRVVGLLMIRVTWQRRDTNQKVGHLPQHQSKGVTEVITQVLVGNMLQVPSLLRSRSQFQHLPVQTLLKVRTSMDIRPRDSLTPIFVLGELSWKFFLFFHSARQLRKERSPEQVNITDS